MLLNGICTQWNLGPPTDAIIPIVQSGYVDERVPPTPAATFCLSGTGSLNKYSSLRDDGDVSSKLDGAI
ncbi:hypothetical protein GWI33_014384 [Rhynchophorus ferrugineus]|uniref:Uncharacterized protein n=1 Tax=Rhynchophorus ferrugineus TaxID=354439 RepID=A0A834M6X9_RHYFE|nr:hypothetical protein GWI33_014384 [Rhynchophorus ferrugineus]